MRVFISYRHTDVPDVAGRLHDHLAQAFGDDGVFLDVEAIQPGQDFREVIQERISGVAAVVVVIGPRFAPERLAQPTDYVRIEVAEALAQGKLLVPVLVGDSRMPGPDDLPAELDGLAYRQAAVLRSGRDFRSDATRLIDSIRRVVGPGPGQTPVGTARDAVRSAAPVHRAVTTGFAGSALALAFSPDGSLLAVAGQDGIVDLLGVADGTKVASLRRHRAAVTSVAFSSSGDLLASGGAGGTVLLWDVAARRPDRAIGHPGGVDVVAFTPHAAIVVSAGQRGVLHTGAYDGRSRDSLRGRSGWVRALAFAPDGRQMAVGYDSGAVCVGQWTPPTVALPGHLGSVRSVAFSPDSRLVAAGDAEGTVHVWEADERRLLLILEDVIGAVGSLAFSPDGSLLAGAGDKDDVVLWDPADGTIARELETPAGLHALAFSPDGTLLAAAGRPDEDGGVAVHLWWLWP